MMSDNEIFLNTNSSILLKLFRNLLLDQNLGPVD
jgi:hypothetical protein